MDIYKIPSKNLGKVKGTTWYFGIKEYLSKTPKILVRIGNTLIAMSAAASGVVLFMDNKEWAMYIMAAGILGKGLTMFFGEPNEKFKDEK